MSMVKAWKGEAIVTKHSPLSYHGHWLANIV